MVGMAYNKAFYSEDESHEPKKMYKTRVKIREK
jgi:hypothetical protein